MSELADYQKMINEQTQLNNSWSAEQAQKQMDFQKMMSDTAHQREVADLKAAGLNPVLSASGGAGASSPSGAMATTSGANVTALADVAMSLAQAENAKAIASMKAASGSAGSYRDPMQNLLWEYLLALTGNSGKSAQQIGQDAVQGTKKFVNWTKNQVNNIGTKISNLWNNILGKSSAKSVGSTSHRTGSFTSFPTYSNGTKYRVSSSGSRSLR